VSEVVMPPVCSLLCYCKCCFIYYGGFVILWFISEGEL